MNSAELKKVEVGNFMPDEEISLEEGYYCLAFRNAKRNSLCSKPFKIYIHREYVKAEAEKRDKLSGSARHYASGEDLPSPISFEEFEEDIEHRSKFDAFVLQLISELFSLKIQYEIN